MKDSYWKRFLYFEKRIISLETYIAFDQNNFQVFSIEILNLYLSICSEIEAIYKEILDDKSEINFNVFKEQFTKTAIATFGSGWAWLVADEVNGNLSILKTSNADTPLAHGKVAVLTIDVWEHAYYIDFRNARPAYIKTFLESLVNWDYANAKYAGQEAGVEK